MMLDLCRLPSAPGELTAAPMIESLAAAAGPPRGGPPVGFECHTPQPTPPVDDEDDEDDEDDDRGSSGGNIDPDDDEGWSDEDDEDEDDTLWTVAG